MKILAHTHTLGIRRYDLLSVAPDVMEKITNTLKDLMPEDEIKIKHLTIGRLNPTIESKIATWNANVQRTFIQAILDYDINPSDQARTKVELACQDFCNRWSPKSEYTVLVPQYGQSASEPVYKGCEFYTRITPDLMDDINHSVDNIFAPNNWIYIEI